MLHSLMFRNKIGAYLRVVYDRYRYTPQKYQTSLKNTLAYLSKAFSTTTKEVMKLIPRAKATNILLP
jgi:hypothetical protein